MFEKTIDKQQNTCYNKAYPKGNERKCKKMKILKSILDYLIFSLTGKGKVAEEMVDKGLIDYSGQGRNKYGK